MASLPNFYHKNTQEKAAVCTLDETPHPHPTPENHTAAAALIQGLLLLELWEMSLWHFVKAAETDGHWAQPYTGTGLSGGA